MLILPPIFPSEIVYMSAVLDVVSFLSFWLDALAWSQTALMLPDQKIQVRRLTDAMKDWCGTPLTLEDTEKVTLNINLLLLQQEE
jgi:hypothetical protein